MSPEAEQLLQSALALSQDDRLELSEALFASCPPTSGLPFHESWLAEIQRRSAEIDSGEAELTPWPEVLRRVRERVEKRHGG